VEKDGNIIGVFPNFIQPIPHLPFKLLFSMDPGYGGPLISKHEHNVLPLMMKQLNQICSKTILSHYIRTNNSELIRYHHFLIRQGYKLNLRYCLFTIPLQARTYEDIKEYYSRAKKRELKKDHIEISDQTITIDSLNSFYYGYVETMQRVGGMTYPKKLLHKLHEYLPDRLKLTRATLNGETIGQHLHFLDNEQKTVTTWIINLKKEYMKYYPSTFIYDYMIRWAINHDFNMFDMGYSLSDYHDGLFKYKQDFGTTRQPLLQYEKSYSPIPLSLIKKGGQLYNKLNSK
jgi:predicted N-acyltransferase